jgi:dTDP-6-deoxy-L-talose 4-dehydrogenase (NAD+)
MKKILVTGATGFIGSYVVELLLQKDCEVIASSATAEHAQKASWFGKVDYIPFNLSDFDPTVDYRAFFNYPDRVLHLAWEGLPNYKSSFHLETNYPRHAAFLENLVSNGVNSVTVTGTCFEYGMQEGILSEEMPAKPENPYGIAKDKLRIYLEQLQSHKSFVLKWARLFYMYGRGQNPNALLSQLEKTLARGEKVFNMSGGEQVRDFLPVEEMAAGIVAIAMQDKVTGIINCCSGEPVTVRHFVENWLQKSNKQIQLNTGYYPYPDYEPMRFWGDNAKLKRILHDN